MADQTVTFRFEGEGVDELAAELEQVIRELKATGREADKASQKTRQFGDKNSEAKSKVTEAGRAFGEAAGALGNIGNIAAQTIPSMSRLAGGIGAVGTASSAASSALGPVGIALTAITTAATVLIPLLMDMGEEMNGAATAAQGLATNLDQILRLRRDMQEAAQRDARLRAGAGSVEEQQAFVAEVSNRITNLEQRRNRVEQDMRRAFREGDARRAADLMGTTRRLQREITDLAAERERRVRALTTSIQSGGEPEIYGPAPGSGGSANRRSSGPRNSVNEQLTLENETRNQMLDEAEARREEYNRRVEEFEKARIQSVAEQEEAAQQRIREQLEATKEKFRENAELQMEQMENLKRRQEQAIQDLKDESESVLAPVVSSLTSALSEVIAGTKSADEAFQGLLSSFLEMIAQQMALSAVKEFAEAIASFARYDYASGGQHLAAGVAFTAGAVAAGAASVAVAPSPSSGPESPQADTSDRSEGGGTTIIQWNSPVVTAGTQAELGRQISGMVRAGNSRFGRA